MKILLTDDERMVRLGLMSMLDELYLGQHTYREARNGQEMLSMAAEFQPDIAFIDIRMPLMDGLEALDRCRQICPYTQYLMLSGHSDFEYARLSLRHGALDYLLKPASLEVLQEAVETAVINIETLVRKENVLFSHYISKICSGAIDLCSDIPAVFKAVRLAVYSIDTVDEDDQNEKYNQLEKQLCHLLEQRISSSFQYTVFTIKTGELCVVCAGDTTALRPVFAKATAGLGPCVSRIETDTVALDTLESHYVKIAKAIRTRCLYGYGEVSMMDASLVELSENLQPLSAELHSLKKAFSHGMEMEYKSVLARLETIKSLEKIYCLANTESVDRFIYASMGCNINAENYQDLCLSLKGCTEILYKNIRPKNTNSEIDIIREYIQKNYMGDIGINSIAELMGISPNYLSRIFHEKVGCKFIDYLTEIRISNAKRHFNQNHSITVKQVAEKVGYISVRHFTKTFAKYAGCLPSEYQAMCQGQSRDVSYIVVQ